MTPQEEQDQLDQIFGPVEDVTPSITGVIDQNPPPGEQSLDEIFGFDAKTPDTPLEGATSAWDEYWKPKQKSEEQTLDEIFATPPTLGEEFAAHPIATTARTVLEASPLIQIYKNLPERARSMLAGAGEVAQFALPAGRALGPARAAAAPEELPGILSMRRGLAEPPVVGAAPPSPLPVTTPFTPPIAVPTPPLLATQAMTEAAVAQKPAELLKKMADVVEGKKRMFKVISESVVDGTLSVPDMVASIKQSGMTMEEYGAFWNEAMSMGARHMQKLGWARKELAAQAAKDPEFAALYKTMEPTIPKSAWNTFRNIWNSWEQPRRAAGVLQWVTQVRNAATQFARYGVDIADQVLQRMMGIKDTTDISEFFAFARKLNPRNREGLMKIFDDNILMKSKILQSPAAEGAAGINMMRKLNVVGNFQENYFRKAVTDSILRVRTKANGYSWPEVVANPKLITEAMWTEAANRSLEMTFAARPTSQFLKDVLDVFKKFPPLHAIEPYPRYWANSMTFLTRFNPLGLVAYRPGFTLDAVSTAKNASVISKAFLGTTMLAAGAAIRNSEYAGPKYNQIWTGKTDAKGNKIYADARPFAPFVQFLFMAEVLNAASRAGAASWANDDTFLHALSTSGITKRDAFEAMLSISRLAGTGLVLAEILGGGTTENMLTRLRMFVGAYLSMFTVPFQMMKDALAGAGSKGEALIRDVRSNDPWVQTFGPAMANVPGISQLLPESPSSLAAGTLRRENPVGRQLTGLAERTLNPVEEEIASLGIATKRYQVKSGNAEFDRVIRSFMGPLVEQNVPEVLTEELYKKSNADVRTLVLLSALAAQRKVAFEAAKVARPDLWQQVQMKKQPAEIEALIYDIEHGISVLGEPGGRAR